jgi:hypothetical protein
MQDTRTYQAIGKMFLMKPKEVVEKRLTDNISSYEQTAAVCWLSRSCDYMLLESPLSHRFTTSLLGIWPGCPLLMLFRPQQH